MSFLPTFTEPVILGTDTAVNSLPDGDGDGVGVGEGEGDGVGLGVRDGLGVGWGVGVGFGAAATATVCADVLLTAAYPAFTPVTLTETLLPASAATRE